MSREAGSQPSVPSFGGHGYCREEQSRLQGQLAKKLGPNLISQRASTTKGQRIAFVETWKLIALANELFGFNGWSNSITSQSIDFVDESDGLYYAGVNACMRVTLRDGTYHEELGYGMGDGLPSKGASLEKARKEAVADGLKRCLRNYGNALGNCLGDKHYLQWVVNQSDAHPSSPSNSSSDSLVSELITASQMTPPANENTTGSGATTVIDMQQQFLQLPLQNQNSLSCLQPAARLGQATFSSQHQQQIPLLAPFALAAATGGGSSAGGLATSSAQQLFLVRPVAAQTSVLATATGFHPGNTFTTQLQQRPPSHQVQRLHGIFNSVTKMSSTACSGASAAQSSLPITIQSGNSSGSGVHTVMTNNFIQPLMANHGQGGMLNLHTALSNSQTNFLNNLHNGLACGVQNSLQNSGQSSISNRVVQNCIPNSSPKSVPSTVSASIINNIPRSQCRNTFAKPGPLSKSTKSSVKAVAQYPARDIANKSTAASHTSRKKGTTADAADIACPTQSYVSRLRVVMPPLEKPVQAATTSNVKSTRGDSGKGRKRSRTQSNLRGTFPSDQEPRQKKASIPLVTIHSSLDPKDDLIDVKQEALDEEESSYSHNIEPLESCEVVMNSYPLRFREGSPKEKQHDAVSPPQITEEAMDEEPCSGATACEELDRSVVADAMSKLYKEGANEQEMDFDPHSDTLRREVESKMLCRIQTKSTVASPVLMDSILQKEGEKKVLCKTQDRVTVASPVLVNLGFRKELDKKMLSKTQDKAMLVSPGLGDSPSRKVAQNMLCKTRDKAMVASPVLVDSGRSPKKVTVHIPVLAGHQENITLDTKVTLDDDKLIDLPDNTSPTAESIKSISFIQTANADDTVWCIKNVKKCLVPDEECLDTSNILVSKKKSLRSVESIPNSEKECSTKSTSKLRKGCTRKPERVSTNKSNSNPETEKLPPKDSIPLNTKEEKTCGTPTNLPLSSNESENTDGESKAKKPSRMNDLTTQMGKPSRSSMTKEHLTFECSNIFQGNGQKVESTSESKSKVSSILKRVNYEKTKGPRLSDEVSIQFENRHRDETSQLKESDPGSHCTTKAVQKECNKTLFKTSGSDLEDGVKDTNKVCLKDNGHPKSDENSNNPLTGKKNHLVANEQVKSPDSKTDEKNTSNILQSVSDSSMKDADPAVNEKPLSLSMEYKDLFNHSNSPLSEDENTFTGFTADMCVKTSPQTLIEVHVKPKPTVDESEKEKQRDALKLDRQRHFRHNLRIQFKGGGGGRASAKKTATAASRRTSGATAHKLANGHQSEELTPASPNHDDLEESDMVEGLDQFATSLGLTPRRLLSDSPVTPPSAFLPEKRSSASSRQHQGKSTSHPLLPFSNILMKTLQQPTSSPLPPGDASSSSTTTRPSDASTDSSSIPSKGVDNRCDEDEEASTSVSETKKTAIMPTSGEKVCKALTMPTLEERRVRASTSCIAMSSSPLQDNDASSKPSSPIITTSIPTESRKESFSKTDTDNLSSKPRNSISLDPTSAVPDLAQMVSDDTSTLGLVTSNVGVTKNNEVSSSSSSFASPSTNTVSSELSDLSPLDCLSPGRLTSNDLSDEASSTAKCSGTMAVGCLEKTHLSSSVDSGIVGSERGEVKGPRSSYDEQKSIEDVPRTNQDNSEAQRNCIK